MWAASDLKDIRQALDQVRLMALYPTGISRPGSSFRISVGALFSREIERPSEPR
jgi:hypothetical protein